MGSSESLQTEPHPVVSVVIVNWNTPFLLEQCLHSIYETASNLEIQVIVVDNASSDRSADLVRERFPQVELIQNSENYGFSRAANRGLARAHGGSLLLAHPDVVFMPGALQTMVDFLASKPDAGVVGANLYYPDGTYNPSSVSAYSFRRIMVDFAYFSVRKAFFLMPGFLKRLESLRESFYWDHLSTRESQVIWNACMMFKRRLLDEIGPFCEDFFVWYADVDWCYRARAAKWKAFYLHEARVLHYERQSAEYIQNERVRYKCDGSLVLQQMDSDKQLLLRRHHSIGLRFVNTCLDTITCAIQRSKRFLPRRILSPNLNTPG